MENSSGSQDSRRGGSRKTGKQPMKFMFIDASDQGVNAKPNKAVRSFVMHQARRQKPWSTRQKSATSPETDDLSPTPGSGRSPSVPHRAEHPSPVGSGPWQDLVPSPPEWVPHAAGSTISSRNGSLASYSSQSSQPCISPTSSFGHVCNLATCTGEACAQTLPLPTAAATATALARRAGFASGSLDPFDCLPVQLDGDASILIRQYVNAIAPHMIPVDQLGASTKAATNWVLQALHSATSAPFINALLTSTSLMLWRQGDPRMGRHKVLHYKARAIEEINHLFADPKTSVDDNNIAAVFMLLCLEESQSDLVPGDMKYDDAQSIELQRRMHYNGLQLMIDQRGGLSGLSSNHCLQTYMLMHSVAHAVTQFQRPYATLLDAVGEPQKYDMPSFRSRPSPARALKLFRDLKIDQALFDIVSSSVVFAGDISAWYEKPHDLVDPLELQKNSCMLQYRLIDWYKKGEEDASDLQVQRSPLDECVCLALLIFLVRASQPDNPYWRSMVEIPMRKLRASMDKRSFMQWARSADLLLWTLTMGVLASHKPPSSRMTSPISPQGTPPGHLYDPLVPHLTDSEYFADKSRFIFRDQGFTEQTNAEEILGRMKKCLWVPSLMDREVKALWTRMGLCRGEEAIEEVLEEEEEDQPELKDHAVVGTMTDTRFFPKR